jgi:hypothetical protein
MPILSGDDLDAARNSARDLATELAAITLPAAGLVHGAAGVALFFSYYGDVTGEQWA